MEFIFIVESAFDQESLVSSCRSVFHHGRDFCHQLSHLDGRRSLRPAADPVRGCEQVRFDLEQPSLPHLRRLLRFLSCGARPEASAGAPNGYPQLQPAWNIEAEERYYFQLLPIIQKNWWARTHCAFNSALRVYFARRRPLFFGRDARGEWAGVIGTASYCFFMWLWRNFWIFRVMTELSWSGMSNYWIRNRNWFIMQRTAANVIETRSPGSEHQSISLSDRPISIIRCKYTVCWL